MREISHSKIVFSGYVLSFREFVSNRFGWMFQFIRILTLVIYFPYAWQRSAPFTPIIIDHVQDASNPRLRQTVTFEGCIFEDMKYGLPFFTSSSVWHPAFPFHGPSDIATMILATNNANTVAFRDCVFRSNQAEGVVRVTSGTVNSVYVHCSLLCLGSIYNFVVEFWLPDYFSRRRNSSREDLFSTRNGWP